ncbi:MAG: hypothetical protein Q9167_002684 [Letrouitia subvulpina]
MSLAPPLFIASIGNPSAAFSNTLHSAGHTVLNHLHTILFTSPFTKSRRHANGLLSAASSGDLALWQSPALMNLSGKPVSQAYRTFLGSLDAPEQRRAARLVVVHDELELPMGKIRVRRGGSARGHNGLKSVSAAMPGVDYTKVGVGIGRVQSRQSEDVAAYVLRKMTPAELEGMWDVAGRVAEVVREMRNDQG